MITLLHHIKKRLDNFISHPGLSERDYLSKQVTFYWTLFNLGCVIILTGLGLILKAYIIAYYGYALITLQGVLLALYGTKLNFIMHSYIGLYLTILITGIYAAFFGGILDSGGILVAGVYCIFMTATYKSIKMTTALVIFFILIMVILALIDPYLSVHPTMTDQINFTFFVINIIWLSASQMFFILYYFNENERYEANEVKRLQELDETKSRLFTNITHEFRTPITLILGLAEQVKTVDKKSKEKLNTIWKNGRKLLRLVNQMLNLSKLESGLMQMHNLQSDLVKYLKFIVKANEPVARIKKINLKFYAPIDHLMMDFDPEKLEEVMTNLVSNAIRYTDNGGTVEVKLEISEIKDGKKWVNISVKDNGVGIPQEKLDNIFDLFYQVQEDSRHHQEGSGVGLTLVKENVKLMGGNINVESREGIGSRFIVTLPFTSHAPIKDILQSPEAPTSSIEDTSLTNDKEDFSIGKGSLPILLIIEDHPEMISYIKSIVHKNYQVFTAIDGFEGLKEASKHIPDIIISDLMMPKMDGFEFLEKLKSNNRTSHIPVIMLTARVDVPSKLKGIEMGAEAYLTKPFNKTELLIRLRKLLEQRRLLKQRYISSNMLEKKKDGQFPFEDQFIEHVHKILNQYIDDDSFGVDELSRSIGMSRTQLYRKFKALTDITVDKYLRKYRLHHAMRLLKTTELNISQIALEVGIPNLAYFSRAFKKEFGYTPSEVISQ